MTSWRRAVSVLASLGVLAAGCSSSDPPSPTSPPSASPTLSNPDRRIEAGDRYVALGDSYTAEYLTGTTDPASGSCLRSRSNYPRQVAAGLGLELTDASCGGATTENATAPQTAPGGGPLPRSSTPWLRRRPWSPSGWAATTTPSSAR